MPYEFRCSEGVLRLVQVRSRWWLEFGGDRAGTWPSADAAVAAVARHASGVALWDALDGIDAPSDLLDWTPTGSQL